MIARMWRGYTRHEDVDAYFAYLRETGVREYTSTAGNQGCFVLCHRHRERAEFLLLSMSDSLDSICGFAGDEIERAVFYPEDDRYLIHKNLTVSHFDILAEVRRSDRLG